MSSKQNGNLIDVNENDGLLSSSFQLSGDQQVVELQEQIKSYKKELTKKDDLITKLSTTILPAQNGHYTDPMIDASTPPSGGVDSLNVARSKLFDLDSPNAELAAAKIKIENLSAEMRELQAKVDLKENFNQDLRSKVQLLKENDARQTVLVESLKDELQHSQKQAETLEQITSKGTIAIETLQRENSEARDKVVELEARLRKFVLSREELEQETESYKRKYLDGVVRMGEVLEIETEEGQKDGVVDVLIATAKTMVQDQVLLRSRVQTLDDALNAHSLETKASRETIMRLVAEVGKEQKNVSEAANSVEKALQERDDVISEKESLQREIDLLKSRLLANDKTWTSSRDELTQTAARADSLSQDVKRLEAERNAVRIEHATFCASVAKALSGLSVEVSPHEDAIKDRILEMMAGYREKKKRIDELEEKVAELSSDLECRRDSTSRESSDLRVARTKTSISRRNIDRERDLEDEIATAEVLRDALRSDKAKYLAFLQQLAEAMKMEEIATDLGYDFNCDVMIARAHQLAKLESDALAEKTSSNYGLQRKVKSLREEVKNKEMHMELLRKKITQLEDRDKTRNGIAVDRDDAIVTAQRLQRKVERLQHALGDERVKVGMLKAKLAETHQLKSITMEQRRKIDELANNVGKLSTSKERQRQRLTSLKRNLSTTELGAEERCARLDAQLRAVTDELKTTRSTLDDVSRREKQLVDFRQMIARVLGMDVSTLAVPDYELMSRLEKLVRNQHIGAIGSAPFVSAPIESAVAANARFRNGFERPMYQTPSPSQYQHSPTPPAAGRDSDSGSPSSRYFRRSRSPSPKRY